MSIYYLEPMDTQFYRTNLPFDSGQDGYTLTHLSPSPRTVYGALRASGFVNENKGLADKTTLNQSSHWGDAHHFGLAFIKGLLILRKAANTGQFILPMPLDLVMEKDGTRIHQGIPDITNKIEECSDWEGAPGVYYLKFPTHINKAKLEGLEEDFFFPSGELTGGLALLKAYLSQSMINYKIDSFMKKESVLTSESRIGIQRLHDKHIAKEAALYAASHSRFKTEQGKAEFGYWVEVKVPSGESPALPDKGILRLGGESRPASYCLLKDTDPFGGYWTGYFKGEVISTIAKQGKFKLFLITPGIFEGNAHPFYTEGNEILLKKMGLQARLVGAALRKTRDPIGGWDIQNSRPKPLQAGVMAGSVYFFEITDWPDQSEQRVQVAEQWFNALNLESLCTGTTAQEGFGIILMGGWYV